MLDTSAFELSSWRDGRCGMGRPRALLTVLGLGHKEVSDAVDPADQLARSYDRAFLVRNYLVARFPFVAMNVGVMPLSSMPPPGLGHNRWSGVCISIGEKK
jgi:hypothetical protein